MRKIFTFGLLLIAFLGNLYSDTTIDDILGSGNTLINNPVESAFDNDFDTTLRFNLGENYGFIQKTFDDNRLLKFIDINGYIPTGVTTYIEYEQEGYIKTSVSSFLRSMDGFYRLDLSEDKIITDTIYIRFNGSTLDQLDISEINIESSSIEHILEKKILKVVDESVSSSRYTGAQHLVDGLIGTVWRTWNNENWGLSHWYVLEEIKNKYKHSRKDSRWQTGYAELEPEIVDKYKTLKLFIDPEAIGDVIISIESENKNDEIATYYLDDHRGRWIEVTLEDYGKISKFKFDVSSSERIFAGIGEVELWGDNNPIKKRPQDIIPYNPQLDQKDGTLFIDTLDYKDEFYIDVIIDNSSEIKSYIDNVLIPLKSITELNGFYRFRYIVSDRHLNTGTNFFKIEHCLDSYIINAQIVKKEINNSIILDETSVTNNRLYNGSLSGETILNFKEGYADVQSIRLYYKELAPEGIFYNTSNDITYLNSKNITDDYIEYEVNKDLNHIGITNPNGLTEVKVLGSNLEIVNPYLKLRFPKHNESMEVQGLGYKVAWGITDTPENPITINGYQTKYYGNYFWVFTQIKKLRETGSHLLRAEMIKEDGNKVVDELNVFLQSNTHEFTLDQEDKIYYTRDNSFNLTGRYNPWTSKIYVNDVLVDSGYNMDFSYDHTLEDGLNIIEVVVKNKKETIVKEIHRRRVYKQVITPSLVITSPGDKTLTNKDSIYVTGFASTVGLKDVLVNGKQVNIQKGRFQSEEIELLEEENLIEIEAIYESDLSTKKILTIYKDLTPPEIKDVLPEENKWFNTNLIDITGSVIEGNGVVVFVNGIKATINGTSFSVNIPLEEDKNNIVVIAKDIAGNITNYPVFNINGDFSGPEEFTVTSNPTGWTNSRRPEITFETTDKLSGLSHYEVSVAGSVFVEQHSPLLTPYMRDGVIPVIVKAYDVLGNYTDSEIKLKIDSIPPDEPTDFRVISGNGKAILKWSENDGETKSFKITHNDEEYIVNRNITDEELNGEVKEDIDYFEYEITDITNGEVEKFEIFAIDRAGNVSEGVIDGIVTGIVIETHDTEKGTFIEFEDVVFLATADSLPEEVEKVVVTEVVSADMDSKMTFPRVSPIISFSVVKKDGELASHVSFEKDFVATIKYEDINYIEKYGIPEQNLGVYYYDTNWSKWIKVPDSAVDVDTNTIYFSTSHFTEFAVQPTVFEDLSPQELASVEFTPFNSKVSHEPLTVSPQGVSSTSMTELSLPGKNGFDFELRRVYDSATAKADSSGLSLYLSITVGDIITGGASVAQKLGTQLLSGTQNSIINELTSSINKMFQSNGDYSYALGQGWRLNLPYIRNNNGGVVVRTPSGSYHDILSMDVIDCNSRGDYRDVTFKAHENEDFILKVTQSRFSPDVNNLIGLDDDIKAISELGEIKDHFVNKDWDLELSGDPFIGKKIPGWKLHEATLIMKDGSKYKFDFLGRFLESTDPTGLNKITADYGDGFLLEKITDSMGRVIRFDYTGLFESSLIPQIEKIWIENDTMSPVREINYDYGNPEGFIGEANIINPLRLPLLTGATDINKRYWDYDYDFRFLFAGEFGVKVNGPALIASLITGGGSDQLLSQFGIDSVKIHTRASINWVFPMSFLEGHGIGDTKLTYTDEELKYVDVEPGDYILGFLPTALQIDIGLEKRAIANKRRVYVDDELIKTEDFSYKFRHSGNKQFYNKKWTKNDGSLKEIHHYTNISKTRKTIFDWSDYIASALSGPFMDAVYQDVKIPVNSQIDYYDAETGEFIKSTFKEYNKHNFRPSKITEKRSDTNFSTQEIKYDNWGNQVKIVNKDSSNERVRTSTTYNLYYSTSNGYIDEALWNESKLGTLSLQQGLPNRHNLLKASKTINHNLKNNTFVTSEQYNEYDSHGQLESQVVKHSDDIWAETTFEYDYEGYNTGELVKTIKPDGQVISRIYDFTRNDYFTVKETYENVENIDDKSKSDIETYKGYDYVMGYLNWSRDGKGYVTEYTYDRLGRKTKEVKPDDNDTINWDPLAEAAPSFRNDNPTTIIHYDKDTLDVTVTENDEFVTIYDFNNLNRLLSISKDDGKNVTKFTYDAYDNIETYTNPNLDVTTFTYNPLGEIETETYTEKVSSIYDTEKPEEELTKVKKTEYIYRNLEKIVTDERGNEVRYTFDFGNNLIKATYYGIFGETRFTTENYYDGLNNVILSIDGEKNATKYEYNSINRLSKTILPLSGYYIDETEYSNVSAYTTIDYDLSGNKKTETIELNEDIKYTTSYTYDGLNRLTSDLKDFRNPDDTEDKTAVNKYVYDKNNNLIKTIDPNNKIWKKVYTARNQVDSEEDPLGNRTSYIYDKKDRLESMTDPRGNSGNYQSLDFTIEYYYDNLHRLEHALIPARYNDELGKLDDKPSISFTYDAAGNVLTRTEPDNRVTTYEYSSRKRVLSEIKSGKKLYETELSYKILNRYDEVGNLVAVINNNGVVNEYTYDVFNQLETEKIEDSELSYIYDNNGNKTTIKNQNNFYHYYDYDALNRLVKESDYAFNDTIFQYDLFGNISYVQDSISNTRKYYYNGLNKIQKETNGKGQNRFYYYDLNGNLSSDKDFNNIRSTYVSKDNNLLESITYELIKDGVTTSQSVNYTYDEAGVIKTVTDNGIQSKYNYMSGTYRPDPYDQIFKVETVDYSTVDYDYDYLNRRTNITYDSGLELNYNYNNLSQLESISNFVTSITYDDNGLKDEIFFNNGLTLDYDFTNKLELSGINYTKNDQSLKQFIYEYDKAGNIVKENLNLFGYDGKNQLITAMLTGGVAEEDYSVPDVTSGEALNDVIGQNEYKEVEIESSKYDIDWGAKSFTIDLNYGYRVRKVILNRDGTAVHKFEKDKIAVYVSRYNSDGMFREIKDYSLVVDEFTQTYTIILNETVYARYIKIHSHVNDLDLAGEPIYTSSSVTFKLNKDNPLEVIAVSGGRNEFYDLDSKGNRVSRSIMSKFIVTDEYLYYPGTDLLKADSNLGYKYDNNGNLIAKGKIEGREADELVFTKDNDYFEYGYDLKNRLVAVQKYINTGMFTVATYTYDSNNYRIKKVDKDGKTTKYIFDLNGNVIEENTDEIHTNFIFMSNRHIAKTVNGEKFFYGVNNVGSTVLLTDENGNKVWDGDVTPFGDKINGDGTVGDTVKYTGKTLDPDTGLYYFNARWYDPNLGRFITEDPIKDGNNWYVYCRNNPLRYVDPTGLIIKDISSKQHQNDPQNRNGNIAGEVTGVTNIFTGDFDQNTVGKYGCLLTAITNIRNTIERNENYQDLVRGESPYGYDVSINDRTVADIANNPDYSDFYKHDGLARGETGKNFGTGPEHMQKLLKDATGDNYSFTRYRGSENAEEMINQWNNDETNAAYIIGQVGGHFINITGLDDEGNLMIHNTYDYTTEQDPITIDDIDSIYVVERSDQKELRIKAEAMK